MKKTAKKTTHKQLDLFQFKSHSGVGSQNHKRNNEILPKTKTRQWGKVGMSATLGSFDYAVEILSDFFDDI